MALTAWRIDARFDIPANQPILVFLRRTDPSAHSDVAEELIRSAAALPHVSHYCPDPTRYAFVVLHRTDDVIVGVCFGQSCLAYRVPDGAIRRALDDGGSMADDLGANWVLFEPWPPDETLDASRRRLARWCAAAGGVMTDDDRNGQRQRDPA